MAGVSRRGFIAGAGLAAASGVTAGLMRPAGHIEGAEAADFMGNQPPTLPGGLRPFLQMFKNWAEDIVVDAVWTVEPATPQQVVDLANWAYRNGWKIRPRGHMHNWSPICIAGTESSTSKVLLVDTRVGLTKLVINNGSRPSVTVGTGVDQERLLEELDSAGYGIVHHPAPGDLTVGGMLAIGGHGTAIPARGETRKSGQTYGSLCNLITSLTAIVWDATKKAYVAKTFRRNDRGIAPLLLHLGRSFILEVTLSVGPRQTMRCQSYTDISLDELLGPPGTSRSLMSYLDKAGRAEIISFPFCDEAWLKVWTVMSTKPFWSRQVDGPFNYPFSDNVPKPLVDMIKSITQGAVELTPTFGPLQFGIVKMGLFGTWSSDIFGSAKDLLMYVKPDTLRVTANGYAVLCRRADVQRVLNDFYGMYTDKVEQYRERGSFPMNGPLEIRVVGIDRPEDCGVAGAQSVWLSPTRPAPDHPEWDCAVYFDILTLPGTRDSAQFYREVEQWMYAKYTGNYARVRVEWSKGWGYSNAAAWGDDRIVTQTVPQMLDAGQRSGEKFADAVAMLNSYDPHRVFTTKFHDRLMPAK